MFDQPVEKYLRTFDNIRYISIGQVHDYTTGFLVEYIYCKKCYKMIETDLSKQKHLMKKWKKQFYIFYKELFKHCLFILL